MRMTQQAIHTTNRIRRWRSRRGGVGRRRRRPPGGEARCNARGASRGDDSDVVRRHVRKLLIPHKLVQVRDQRIEHVPATHSRRVAHVHRPAPLLVAADRADPQRAARRPRRRLCVVRDAHRDRGRTRPRAGEEDRARGDAEVPGECG